MGFEPSISGLQFDANLASKVYKVDDFLPDRKVGQFMPVVIDDHTTQQRTKSLVRTEVKLGTYLSSLTISSMSPIFKACLLLWSTNTIYQNSILISITYPKHSQIHFVTGNPTPHSDTTSYSIAPQTWWNTILREY